MTNAVVIVESPAKAKTINKYLGSGYTVLASFGHIRDLPSKDGSVDTENRFAMRWELSERANKTLADIVKAVKKADTVYLAPDPDREGEAIAWHVRDVLEERGVLKGVDVKRVTFNEITKSAITAAMKAPRNLDQPLIDAYLARRALDYLVGFSLSPVLWRKLPGSRSAGRVQSVALRLICERESEIEAFKKEEYWTIAADFKTSLGQQVPGRLVEWDGKKLEKFDINNEKAATAIVSALNGAQFTVSKVERKQVKRNPAAPFTTSTLQQEASRKLYFGATRTMRTAQQLYEGADIGGETVGLITYMRTDGVTIAAEAIASIRSAIAKDYGNDYLPPAARVYTSKAKNAQEAHEAVRPTDITRRPEHVAKYLNEDQLKLYTLIWQRTMASQMAAAVMDQVSVDIVAKKPNAMFRATGSVVRFTGYLSVYQEGREDEENEEDRRLPDVQQSEAMGLQGVTPSQHFTEPPPRYSEASLVKALEELGIGRPSTYASIMQVLQDRNYVVLDKRRFTPEDRGRLVTAFLVRYFPKYVEYNFTAELEEDLDKISEGKLDYQKLLRDFWKDFSAAVDDTKELRISDVLDVLDAELGPHFFPDDAQRDCPQCKKDGRTGGRLNLKIGKFGAFIGCHNYPECKYTRPLTVATDADGEMPVASDGPKELGVDEETGLMVTLRRGPYGAYVQLGEAQPAPKKKKGEKTEKSSGPKRMSLPRGLSPADLDLATAQKLLQLPRLVGIHPDKGEKIVASIGRFGPYLQMAGAFKSIPAGDDVLSIGLNRAVDLLASVKDKPAPVELGTHPKSKKPVLLAIGRFGPYIRSGKVMANVPKGERDSKITLERAIELLDAKAGTKGNKKQSGATKAANTDTSETNDKEKKPRKAGTTKPAGQKKAGAKKPKAAGKTGAA